MTLVVPVPDVGEGDMGLLAELRVTRGMLESENKGKFVLYVQSRGN